MELLVNAFHQFAGLIDTTLNNEQVLETTLKFIPFVICFELPYQGLVMLGVIRRYLRRSFTIPKDSLFFPRVTCIITCYGEGEAVRQTIKSLVFQLYPGHIELLVMIDGASANTETLAAARQAAADLQGIKGRRISVIPKWQRGGRVSSLNSGLAVAKGDIIFALDGDTSFDNDMISHCALCFRDENVIGVAGNLRVRNARRSLCTRMQTIEYMTSISAGRTGLGEMRVLNNISGAFGAFRKDFLHTIGGWRTGSAEDLDITTRIKNYFGRSPRLKIVFEPRAIGHTDVPVTFAELLRQRTRWDGDLSFIYLRRYWKSFTPRLFGWSNFLFYAGFGLLFQLIAPLAIAAYTMFLFFSQSPAVVLGVLAYVYLFYLLVLLAFYCLYLLMVSERPRYDIHFLPAFPLYPLYAFSLRLWSAYATLKEMVLNANLDSSMAPWWVLRKLKKR